MFDVFGSVKGLIKLESICIDNNIFRLHYKATVLLLIVCSLLVTSRQYIGDPIDCIVEEIPNNVMVSKLGGNLIHSGQFRGHFWGRFSGHFLPY